MDSVLKSEPIPWSSNQIQASRRRYSLLVSQLKVCFIIKLTRIVHSLSFSREAQGPWIIQAVAFIFLLIFQNSLRLVETGEFILIPSKTRGRIGRLELNQVKCLEKCVITFLKTRCLCHKAYRVPCFVSQNIYIFRIPFWK